MQSSGAGATMDSMSGIVVGVDDSPSSKNALRWAVEEARLRGTSVHVVSAWEFPFAKPTTPEDDPLPGVPTPQETARTELTAAVSEAGADPGSADVTVEVVHGSPSRVLLDIAAAEEADLLVVGTHGRGGISGLVLGSVSRQVIQHATCPVVVVR